MLPPEGHLGSANRRERGSSRGLGLCAACRASEGRGHCRAGEAGRGPIPKGPDSESSGKPTENLKQDMFCV